MYAGFWHGGQWTRLYALASTGAPSLYPARCQHCEREHALGELAVARAETSEPESWDELDSLTAWVRAWAPGSGPCAYALECVGCGADAGEPCREHCLGAAS